MWGSQVPRSARQGHTCSEAPGERWGAPVLQSLLWPSCCPENPTRPPRPCAGLWGRLAHATSSGAPALPSLTHWAFQSVLLCVPPWGPARALAHSRCSVNAWRLDEYAFSGSHARHTEVSAATCGRAERGQALPRWPGRRRTWDMALGLIPPWLVGLQLREVARLRPSAPNPERRAPVFVDFGG